jgi:hypothetical protein
MLTGSYRWNPTNTTEQYGRAIPREGQRCKSVFDAFATLNYSKRSGFPAVNVEQHLRSKGALCPCNDSFGSHTGGMASQGNSTMRVSQTP